MNGTGAVLSKPKAALALAGAVLAMCMALFAASPPKSDAFTTQNYCEGVTLSGWNICQGSYRNTYAVFGWGDNHSVCVYVNQSYNYACSGGPGQGVYSALGGTYYTNPGIQNNANGANTVHGRSYNN